MKKALWGISTVLLGIALLAMFGCKTQAEVKTGGTDKPASPLGGGELGKDEGGGGTGLSAEDEKLVVPGSQYGDPPPIKKATKKKKKKKKGKPAGPPQHIPYTDAVAEQMEGLEWGMTYKKVISVFEEQVKAKYADELAGAAGDALMEDQVRTKMRRENSKLRKSFVEFEGQTTGFESHMIAEEFTHNNGESMLMWDAGKYVEYLFFFNGRFWKRLRAFRIDSFATEIDFLTFLTTLENRFGQGKQTLDDEGNIDHVMWRDETTYVAAMDRSGFFGAFGLKFTAAVTETYLDKLRTNKGRETGKVGDDISQMVESVTSADGAALPDHESSVIDSYTGGQATGGGTIDTSKSVVGGGEKKKEKKKEKAAAEEEAPKKEKAKEEKPPDKDFLDDLF
jgi:hypothetical protein